VSIGKLEKSSVGDERPKRIFHILILI